ncbi:DegT/DnrJ/EryC1/StrS family aminotransferase [Vampirovibrio chlorellavorus]|uniref:DegT/DnrJ/EryC1/StrS family aminotransferase n=1 Tax=Vampirovibrio chlorellavorus TaxID=758823 RepID=UPI0026EC03FF|nr:DegT/DnrJ/EryC1/StrS family aminotransferase [Vampirovibrio chlorellavorus]
MIPILNLTRQYEQLKDRIDQALIQVAASGHYILGPEVTAFEQEMADYLKVKHVIGCANGTDALFLALKALKIGPGDEVITTPFSYMATSESIVRAEAKPVFVDIDADTMNFNISRLEAAITPHTKAILPVHIFGQSVDMDAVRALAEKHGLAIVEDCAQAIGSHFKNQKVGTIGDIGCFSFFPSKNLGAFGDGGMCTTNDDRLVERLRMLRVHGSRKRYYHEEPGLNSRLDEIQAAILRVKLPHIDEWNHARQAVAHRYDTLLAPLAEWIQTPRRAENSGHVFHQYTIQLKGPHPAQLREQIQQRLQAAQVQSMIYYPVPLYKQQTHASLNLNPADFPVCEEISNRVLSLPMFPELRLDEQEQVVQALTAALKAQPVPA